jgi:peptide/nickel transport system ATP-binding protein
VSYRTASGDVPAVDDVSLDIRRGEILGLAGESGCGKSTLAMTVLRLLHPPGYIAGGTVEFVPEHGEAIDLTKAELKHIRRLRWSHLAYLPQGSMNALNPVMRVRTQMRDVMEEHSDWSRREIDARIVELLGAMDLIPEVANQYPHELSGGMKQRVIMAMAIALEPELIVADEPTTALDVTIQRSILLALGLLRERLGVAMLLITHDMGVHAQLADRVAVMLSGKVVELGDVRQIFKDPRDPYTKALIESIPTMEVRTREDQAPRIDVEVAG